MPEMLTASSDTVVGIQIDPVCGMSIDVDSAALQSYHNNRTVYFCSNSCLEKFEVDPWLYVSGKHAKLKTSIGIDTPYTCPMHLEVVQNGAGSCPICGMALEPVAVESTPDRSELLDYTRRFWIGLLLAVPGH